MTIENTMTRQDAIANITQKYMDQIDELAVRPFTLELNRPLIDAGLKGFSHQTVHNWLCAKSIPGDKMRMLLYCTQAYPNSWQHKFASEILAIAA